MMTTKNLRAKHAPDVTLALAQTIQRDLAYPGRKRIFRYPLCKATARELQVELKALWMLYHNAQRMVRWLSHLGRYVPHGEPARAAIASELRSARRALAQIRQSRDGIIE